MDAPTQNVTAKIKGQEYEVRFSLLAQLVLDQEGVDTRKLAETMRSQGTGKVALMMKLFAAGTAHYFVKLGQKPLTAEEWALRADGDEDAFKQMCTAVTAAMGKAPSPATAAEPAPTADAAAQVN